MREARLIHRESKIGENVGTWFNDWKDHYVVGPFEKGDVIQIIAAPFAAAASAVLEGPDQIIDGAFGVEIAAPEGIMGRTRNALGETLNDAVHLRPIKTFLNGIRTVTTALPMDTIDVLGGFRNAA